MDRKNNPAESGDLQTDITLKEVAFEVRSWSAYLASKWLIIIGFSVLAAVGALAYALIRKPYYTARTTFVLEENSTGAGGLGQVAGLAALVGIDIGGENQGIFQGDNIIALYKSRVMLERALLQEGIFDGKKQLLVERYIQGEHIAEKWSDDRLLTLKFIAPEKGKATRYQDSVITEVVKDINKKNLLVEKPDKKLNVISVEIKSKDEDFANVFNQMIVSVVNQFYVQTKTKKSINNIEILQHKTDSVKQVMYGAINTAAKVVDQTPNLNTVRQSQRVAPVQRATFLAESNKLILGELVKNLELSKMNFLKEKPLIQVIDKPVLPLDKEKSLSIKLPILLFVVTGTLISFILAFIRYFKSSKSSLS